MSQRSTEELVDEVMVHWFGSTTVDRYDSLRDKWSLWYGSSKEIDDDIRNRFGHDVELALEGAWDHLIGSETRPIKAELTLVIMLDQFTRNIHRGTAKAFAADSKCLQVVNTVLVPEKWQQATKLLSPSQCVFFLLPLMHQESVEQHDRYAQMMNEMIEQLKTEGEQGAAVISVFEEGLNYAKKHREIIQRFGRYPYRNQVLGRVSTPEELEFLKDGPRFGQ